jgi:general secretion pathway protein E
VIERIYTREDFPQTLRVLRAQGMLSQASTTLSGIRFYQGKGCIQCQGSGFIGRIGVFELFEVDDEMRDMIMQRKPASAIRSAAIAKGMKTMFQDGLAKAILGETTVDEVMRVAL